MIRSLLVFIPLLLTQQPPDDAERLAQLPPTTPDVSDDRISLRPSGKLDVRFREVSVFDALELLSEQADRNIVVETGVSGTVSLVLRQVSFEEALTAVLRANNLVFESREGIIYVSPGAGDEKADSGATAAEVPETRVFKLNYVTATQAEEFIKPLLESDSLVTKTSEPVVGIESDKESAGGFASAGAELLVVVAKPKNLKLIEKALVEFDSRPAQVLVEATIMRATLNDQNALGIDFNTLMGVNLQLMAGVSPGLTDLSVGNLPEDRLDDFSSTLRTDFNDRVPAGGFTIGIVKDHVGAFVRALEQITDVTIMANPKMLTLNKQRGEVIVGRRDGYLTTTVTETAAVQSVEYLETGTKLIFRPFVTGKGEVRMEIHPEDSNGGLTAANLPFQETTEATTNILLKDGHTIMIGGLFRERSTVGKSQVPVVGNIPFIGNAFGVQQDQTVREEVIILLTVHILNDDRAADAKFAETLEDSERLRVGARKGLMGTGREQLAEARYQDAVECLRAGQIDKALSSVQACLHMNPRHIEAIQLKEKLESRRTWNSTGVMMRTFLHELLAEEQGNPRRPLLGLPATDGLIPTNHPNESESPPAERDDPHSMRPIRTGAHAASDPESRLPTRPAPITRSATPRSTSQPTRAPIQMMEPIPR